MSLFEANCLELVRSIVLRRVDAKRFAVFLFGSRAENNARHGSDIDIGIWGDEKFPRRTIAEIQEELEESIIPYHVDIVDFATVNDDFKQIALTHVIPWNLPQNISVSLPL
ncbi:MAG: nucleotidyltransferase domain-containing protein [Ignavibacteriae bacterium]|nr:nucleotidyltransferase domain-containing protein [Ignavibacteriota bacterium]